MPIGSYEALLTCHGSSQQAIDEVRGELCATAGDIGTSKALLQSRIPACAGRAWLVCVRVRRLAGVCKGIVWQSAAREVSVRKRGSRKGVLRARMSRKKS